jgi:hypothetical protein
VLVAIILVLLVIHVLVLTLLLTTRAVRVTNSAAHPVPVVGTTSVSGPVVVGNTPANAIPVKEVSPPVLQPFVHSFSDLGFNSGEDRSESKRAFTVPAGKRLVLEDISIGANLGTGQRVEIDLIRIGTGGEYNRHGIAVFYQVSLPSISGPGIDFLAGGRPIRLYLEPGEQLTVTAARDSTALGAFIDVFVYGYFVDLA